ncbi:pentatricopeptide repeat-containing protein chloroplastic [Dorcoceras hygrometricum]|uniref:Pentatricopeptide repeat-containing protein chloroplastic n=1 Tax=Dorcoceras hygrometricum TaxID=472368 RepID=A0A2Z7A6M4_9LAMI|nr:pentatricopeptide repeat-containing protein chloroplastic [Dorcoceras hygrometricum]
MSLFDLQDVCIAIGSIATLDLPIVVDLIGIYGLKGPYCTLTTTNWFLQALSVIPRGSWGDVARRSYHDSLGKSGMDKAVGNKHTEEEHMSIDDLLLQISDDMMLPSVTTAEITKIRLGESININEVHERDWHYASLPRISTHDKGKEPLEENEPVRGNPAKETVELICGDVDFLVQLRDKVMTDVVDFFHSFSLNKLSDFDGLRELKEKEKLMLPWAETEFLETAIKRRMYILAKYREMLLRKFLDSHRRYFAPGKPWTAMASQIISLLSVAHSKSLEDLLAQQKEHGIITDRPSSSQLFKDLADNSGAVLAQFYSMAKSTCWVRPMILVNECSARFNAFKKVVLAQGVTAGADSVEVRKEIKALDAKINSLDGQLGDLVDYIRGGDAKKGEGSSRRRPLPPPVNQGEGSGNRTSGDTVRTTEIAQRDIDNAQRDILERLMAADRQRERERDSGSETVGLSNQLFGLSGQIVTVGSVFRVMVAANRHRNCTKEQKVQRTMLEGLDEQVAALRNDLLDFCAKAEENHLNLSTQLGFLVDYINRDGDAKKGEGGSSRPQPPPDDQERPSGGSTGRGSSGGDGSQRRSDRGGSSKKRHRSTSGSGSGSGSGRVTYGPYLPPKRDAEYWISGKRQFYDALFSSLVQLFCTAFS